MRISKAIAELWKTSQEKMPSSLTRFLDVVCSKSSTHIVIEWLRNWTGAKNKRIRVGNKTTDIFVDEEQRRRLRGLETQDTAMLLSLCRFKVAEMSNDSHTLWPTLSLK